MIEESLNALTSALDRLTAALQHPAPTATEAPIPVPTDPAKRTRRTQAQIAADQVALDSAKSSSKEEPSSKENLHSLRALAQKLLDAGHPDKIREINTSLGIARISEAQPEQFAQLEQLLTKALNGLGDI